MAIKYKITHDCEYLRDSVTPLDPEKPEEKLETVSGRYPFRMFELEHEENELRVRTSTRAFPNHSTGFYPIAQKEGQSTLSGTIGNVDNIVNNISFTDQIDVNAAGFQKVELCYEDFSDEETGLPFAKVKGAPLRLPLRGKEIIVICSCQCGNKYSNNLNFSKPPIVLPNVSGPRIDFRAFFPELFNDITLQDNPTISGSILVQCVKIVQKGPLSFEFHRWSFGSGYIARGVRAGSVPHPKCASIPMVRINWASGSIIHGKYSIEKPPFLPVTQWDIAEVFQGVQQGSQIGIFCDDGPRVEMGTTSDITTLNDSLPNFPVQPTVGDYPDSEEQTNCPPNFPAWTVTITRTINKTGKFIDCDAECDCP